MIEYTTTSRDYYTNGVDVHGGRNWIDSPQPVSQHPGAAGTAGRTGDSDVERLVGHGCGRQHVHQLPAGNRVRADRAHRRTITPAASSATTSSIGGSQSPVMRRLACSTHRPRKCCTTRSSRQVPIPRRSSTAFRTPPACQIANNLLDGAILARDGAPRRWRQRHDRFVGAVHQSIARRSPPQINRHRGDWQSLDRVGQPNRLGRGSAVATSR